MEIWNRLEHVLNINTVRTWQWLIATIYIGFVVNIRLISANSGERRVSGVNATGFLEELHHGQDRMKCENFEPSFKNL